MRSARRDGEGETHQTSPTCFQYAETGISPSAQQQPADSCMYALTVMQVGTRQAQQIAQRASPQRARAIFVPPCNHLSQFVKDVDSEDLVFMPTYLSRVERDTDPCMELYSMDQELPQVSHFQPICTCAVRVTNTLMSYYS